MAAPAFFGAGSGVADATVGAASISPAYPASVAANDIALIAVQTNGNNTFSIPVGTLITNTNRGDGNMSCRIHWQRLSGSEGGTTITITAAGVTAFGTSNGLYGRIYVYRGCITSGDPWEASVGANNALTDKDTNAITTLGEDRRILHFALHDNDDAWTTAPPPAGWALEVADFTSTTGGDCRQSVGGKNRASAGTESAVNYGVNAAIQSRQNTFALIPVPAASKGVVVQPFPFPDAVLAAI